MEFLAESIGLLDMDGGGGLGGSYNSPPPPTRRKNHETSQARSCNSSFTTPVSAAASFLFSPWGSEQKQTNSSDTKDDGDGDGRCDCLAKTCDHDHSGDMRASESPDQQVVDEDNNGVSLGASSMSLLSTLTPASPLTLSSSSLNLFSLTTPTTPAATAPIDDGDHSCCSDHNGDNTANDCQCSYCLSNQRIGLTKASAEAHATTYNNTKAAGTSTTPAIHNTPATNPMIHPSNNHTLTKHVTQRIDARTRYDCFTGMVDAVTGNILHGTMLYRKTGDVYEGPFITHYSNNATSTHDMTTNGETENYADNTTISLRHGMNATCHYSNGMTFTGSFEYDRPKNGKWVGIDKKWTYEGPLIAVTEDTENNNANNGPIMNIIAASATAIPRQSSSNGSLSNLSKIIGIPHPLPGPVLFHGKGRYIRPHDGFEYQGEFLHGVASGVGKETLSFGRSVYYGEFSNGLRHGVGTLMEDYDDEEEKLDQGWEGKCGNCQCEERGNNDEFTKELFPSSRFENAEDSPNPTTVRNGGNDGAPATSYSGNDGGNNNSNNTSTDDRGPDFAAGGSTQDVTAVITAPDAGDALATPPTTPSISNPVQPPSQKECLKCHGGLNYYCKMQQQQQQQQCQEQRRTKNPKRKQRYSSGVWCAGQYEIEDCRGIVHPDSNEFTEEGPSGGAVTGVGKTDGTATTAAAPCLTSLDSSTSSSLKSSLKRTTWDMLDEKWLGI